MGLHIKENFKSKYLQHCLQLKVQLSFELDKAFEEENEPRHDKTCLREFPTRPDTNRPALPQKLARVLKYRL